MRRNRLSRRAVLALGAASLVLRDTTAHASAFDSQVDFPSGGEWKRVAPADVGWRQEGIDAALNFAFKRKSSSVVILHGGRILAERNADVAASSARLRRMTTGKTKLGHAIEDVASVQKSVVSFLVGVAQEKGLVKLSDPVSKHLGHRWSKATPKQERAITLRHLITMSSGLSPRLRYVAVAGTQWRYNTTAYSKSLTVIAKASGMTENKLTKKWLTGPTGMSDSKWVRRQQLLATADANKFGFATSARDLARFGLLVLAGGKWKGEVLLGDADYLKASTSTSQEMNLSYGYLWWLNGKASAQRGTRKVNGPLIPTAPKDMFSAMGALGRKCHVVPSLQLVVTRLGDAPEEAGGAAFDREFWRLLMKAAPES